MQDLATTLPLFQTTVSCLVRAHSQCRFRRCCSRERRERRPEISATGASATSAWPCSGTAPVPRAACPAGGGHNAQGFLFNIHYDNAKPPTPFIQWDWRSKCMAMFWDGDPNNKGRCQAGGAPTAQGLMFGLSMQAPGQSDWRFCDKCRELFWNGIANKGRCPAGGGNTMRKASASSSSSTRTRPRPRQHKDSITQSPLHRSPPSTLGQSELPRRLYKVARYGP